MKKVDLFVFSGTGNTMKCAKELDERLKEKKDDKRVRECDTAHKDKS